jgi:hypothetical protein
LKEETAAQKAEEKTLLDSEMLPGSEAASSMEDLPNAARTSNASLASVGAPKTRDTGTTVHGASLDVPGKQQEKKRGIVVDAEREVRMKLYMEQVCFCNQFNHMKQAEPIFKVFMGWLWFIPAFHLPPRPSPAASAGTQAASAKLFLTRKDIDFPVGVGKGLIDVEIEMEWVERAATETEKAKSLDNDADPVPGEKRKKAVGEAANAVAGGQDPRAIVHALKGDKN